MHTKHRAVSPRHSGTLKIPVHPQAASFHECSSLNEEKILCVDSERSIVTSELEIESSVELCYNLSVDIPAYLE